MRAMSRRHRKFFYWRKQKIFLKLRAFFIFLFLFLGALALFFGISKLSRNYPKTEITNTQEDRTLTSTFDDNFSGTGWLNREQTTMHQDFNAAAFIFPPQFDWRKVDEAASIERLNLVKFIERKKDGSAVSCLADTRCLIEKDLRLLLREPRDGSMREIELPAELRRGNLFSLSVGALENKWVLGSVFEKDGGYSAQVFYFNGSDFAKIDVPISSSYEGFLGFGGSDDDWLLIYSGYDGLGYRVRISSDGKIKITDISRFLGVRLMDGGFEPAIIRAVSNGQSLSADVRWYIFSLTKGLPKLIKLFENRSGEIQGVVDLRQFLTLPAGAETVSFALEKSDLHRLATKIKYRDGREEFWSLSDLGFDKSNALKIVSTNLDNYSLVVTKAKISVLDLLLGGNRADFFLSNNGKKWYKTSFDKEVVFSDSAGRELYWKAEFYPSSDPETSVFLNRLSLYFRLNLE